MVVIESSNLFNKKKKDTTLSLILLPGMQDGFIMKKMNQCIWLY